MTERTRPEVSTLWPVVIGDTDPPLIRIRQSSTNPRKKTWRHHNVVMTTEEAATLIAGLRAAIRRVEKGTRP